VADRGPIWHPFTQHALAPAPIRVDYAEGATLHTTDGRTILDAISSWWVNLHGHAHPHIANAIADQTKRLEQVIFAGFTHETAERFAEKLLGLVPGTRFAFFSDSGSTAVEVAIKMAVGAWHNRGHPRTRIIALEHGYHGDMFGAMAVGHRGVFNAAYAPMLFEVVHLPFPHKGEEMRTVEALAALLEADNGYAALIAEPLVLGAGGMKMYPPHVLAELSVLCRRHDVFLILDEVMTGFGRTGTMFACEQAGVMPDLMCLSKGVTGGFLPMGVTLASEEIYDAFYAADRARTFFHSSSYTGNAIACAAALANLEVFEQEPVFTRMARIAAHHEKRLERLRRHRSVAEVRRTGTIAAIELQVSDEGYLASLAPKLYDFYLSRDVLLRPLGNVVYVLPPYCTTIREIDRIYDLIEESLALV
jgi:adenosylmethionine-8-amino-7-oxononanoate aminotransferase